MNTARKLHITSKPATPECEVDLIADARKLAAQAKKMSKAQADALIAAELAEAGVSEKASNNGCALFAASAISLLAIAAVVVGVVL
jgi:hypothetical protein